MVLALGGGAFVEANNASLLETAATPTVYLDAPPDELWRRCAEDSVERPLRRDESAFRQLYETRRPRYLRARLQIATGGQEIERIDLLNDRDREILQQRLKTLVKEREQLQAQLKLLADPARTTGDDRDATF